MIEISNVTIENNSQLTLQSAPSGTTESATCPVASPVRWSRGSLPWSGSWTGAPWRVCSRGRRSSRTRSLCSDSRWSRRRCGPFGGEGEEGENLKFEISKFTVIVAQEKVWCSNTNRLVDQIHRLLIEQWSHRVDRVLWKKAERVGESRD